MKLMWNESLGLDRRDSLMVVEKVHPIRVSSMGPSDSAWRVRMFNLGSEDAEEEHMPR